MIVAMLAIIATVLLGAVDVQPCEVEGQKAECGRVSVPENRGRPAHRAIDLNVVLLRHDATRPGDDPIFILAGGPGQSATSMLGFAAERFAGADRDLVFVDARGTGGSNPLNCDLGGNDEDPQGYLAGFLPLERVKACLQALRPRADLTQYTTKAIVDDLEAVRQKLGYRKINLYGASYGTRVAQEFMRHYSSSTRLVIVDGVTAPSMITPGSYARDAQASLEGIFALCAADAECRAAYPKLRGDYRTMLDKVANGISVAIEDPKTGKELQLRIERGLFGEAFRNFLYSPEVYIEVPYIVHQAASGRFEDIGRTALNYGRGIRSLSFGMFLSVTCTEEIPRHDVAAARQAAAGTLLGSYRIEQQVAACELWPRGVADPARVEPVRSSIPTLLISGEFDPVTAPKYAARVARTLPNSLHVIVPKGSHANEAGGCLNQISVDAMRAGTVRALDVACVENSKAPKFTIRGSID